MGIIAEGIDFDAFAQLQTEVTEEFIVIVKLRRAPDLGVGLPDVGIARVNQFLRVGALNAAVGRVGIFVLEAEIGKPRLDQRERKRHAQVARNVERVTVSLVELAPAGFHPAAVRSVFQDEIHHAGDGVGPVLRGRAVAQHFHAVERNGRNHGQIRCVCPVRNAGAQEGDDGRTMSPFAVDQNQEVVGRQAAQVRRAYQRCGVTDGLLVDVVGGHGGGQEGVHVSGAVRPEIVTREHVNRHRRILDRATREP